MKWETLGPSEYRIKVPTGWLVKILGYTHTMSLVFIPDPKHEWKLKDEW